MRTIILALLASVGIINIAAGFIDPAQFVPGLLWGASFIGLAVAIGAYTRPEPEEPDEPDPFWGV